MLVPLKTTEAEKINDLPRMLMLSVNSLTNERICTKYFAHFVLFSTHRTPYFLHTISTSVLVYSIAAENISFTAMA